MMNPKESWVARWQAIGAPDASSKRSATVRPRLASHHVVGTFVPGCYALRVRGVLPNNHVVTLEDNGIRYRQLDGS